MPGFTQLLAERGITPVAAEDFRDVSSAGTAAAKAYVLDNSQLRSTQLGIMLRRQPDLAEVAKGEPPIRFGDTVFGTPYGQGWIQVGEHFLPVEIDGRPVLQRAPWLDDETAAPDDDNDNSEASTAAPAEMRSIGSLRVPARIEPDLKKPAEGSGAPHEVVGERVISRMGPSVGAQAKGFAKRGRVVRLFEWDESRLWRRCWDDRTGWGWMMLDHLEYGPLLRPLGSKLSASPLEPLCVAASEGDAEEVRHFLAQGLSPNVIDLDGCTPLLLAGAEGHLACCVLLVGAGADTTVALAGARDREGQRTSIKTPMAKALLSAFAGRQFDKLDYQEALSSLPSDLQAEAEALVSAATITAAGAKGVERARPSNRDSPPRMEGQHDSRMEGKHDSAADAEGDYEVVFTSVWVRREPSSDADSFSRRWRGDVVRVLEFDRASGLWGRIEFPTSEGRVSGWMCLQHPDIGVLLRPVRRQGDEPTAG